MADRHGVATGARSDQRWLHPVGCGYAVIVMVAILTCAFLAPSVSYAAGSSVDGVRPELALPFKDDGIAFLYTEMQKTRQDMKEGFQRVDKWFEKVDKGFEKVDKGFEKVDKGFEKASAETKDVSLKVDTGLQKVQEDVIQQKVDFATASERVSNVSKRVDSVESNGWTAFIVLLGAVLSTAVPGLNSVFQNNSATLGKTTKGDLGASGATEDEEKEDESKKVAADLPK